MASHLHIFAPDSDWTEERYQCLIDAGMSKCDSFTLCSSSELSAHGAEVLGRLAPHLVYERRSHRWPGTIHLGDSPPILFKFRLCDRTARILRQVAVSPWDWVLPDMPEDLALLREDGRPWFVSIAHERDAYFKLFEHEKEEVEGMLGVSLDDGVPDERPDERF